ncbi:MAG: CoA ester lyase [Gammaproteobacteria bacterium]|nr:CoA ester lyase [Gammaproteobacteria bacterium]
MKLRRSVLYVPGNNQRALEKSHMLAVDCVVYDLEDSVSPQAKDEARDCVLWALAQENAIGQERIVRINSLHSSWVEQDVAILKQASVDAVLLPKVTSVDDIHNYRKLFGPQSTYSPALWLMAETAAAVLNLSAIAAADPAVRVVMMGLEDLTMETQIKQTPDREGLLYALSACVMAARAGGLQIIDGVYTSLDDDAGFLNECTQAKKLGFDGKSLIHPRQVDVCNRCFSPTEEEVLWASEIVAVWEAKATAGHSVVVVNGRMVEHLHVIEARRILALANIVVEHPVLQGDIYRP